MHYPAVILLFPLALCQIPFHFDESIRVRPSPFLKTVAAGVQNVEIPPLRSPDEIAGTIRHFHSRSAVQPTPAVLTAIDDNEEEETFREGPLDTRSKLAVRLGWKAFEEDVNERIADEWMWVPIKVLSGEGKIVSGVLYDLRVLAGVSNCSRYEVSTYALRDQHCTPKPGGPRAIFDVLISEKSSQWNTFIPDSARVYTVLERKLENGEQI